MNVFKCLKWSLAFPIQHLLKTYETIKQPIKIFFIRLVARETLVNGTLTLDIKHKRGHRKLVPGAQEITGDHTQSAIDFYFFLLF